MLRFVIRHKLAVAAFVVATAYVPGLFSSAYMPRWWAIAVLLPLASDLDPRAIAEPARRLLLLGLAWTALSLLWTPIPAEGAMDLFCMALLVLAMTAGACTEDISPVVEAFGWGIAVSSAVVLAYHLGYPTDVQNSGRGGLFLSTEIIAEVAAPVLVWALWKRRWALSMAMVVPLALCDSRISVIAAAAGLAFGWRPRRVWIKSIVVVMVMVAAAASVVSLGLFKISTGLTRFVLWGAAAESITTFGHGLGWWTVAHPGPMEEYVHSDVLQFMVELGAGSLFLLAVPIMALWRGVGNVAERSAFLCLIVEGIVSFPTHLPASGFLAALLAGRMVSGRYSICRAELDGRAGALRPVRRPVSSDPGVVPDVA